MPNLSLDASGLTLDERPFPLPLSRDALLSLLGPPASEEKMIHGTNHVFSTLALTALEDHHAPAEEAICQLTFDLAALPGSFLVEGVPWREVKLRKTPYGLQKKVGAWVISADESAWTLYVKEKARRSKAEAGKVEAAKRAPAKRAAGRRKKAFDLGYPEVARRDTLRFADDNFKLMVLEHLMFEKKALKPAIDLGGFVAAYEKRDIDLATEGYDAPIPEVLKWLLKYPIDKKHAAGIRALRQHPGGVIMAAYPQWTGEDDTFVIESAEDAAHFPALREVALFSKSKRHDEKLARAFRARGVTASF